jgi:dihydroneopterin aldolase
MSHFSTRVFVRALRVEAEIGLNAHEQGRRQTLIVDVELDLTGEPWRSIHQTVNYEKVVAHARALADEGHVLLVETFAWRLARACLREEGVTRARVRVEKPLALAPSAEGAGAEVVAERT